jgi:hypothetical protein
MQVNALKLTDGVGIAIVPRTGSLQDPHTTTALSTCFSPRAFRCLRYQSRADFIFAEVIEPKQFIP